MAKIKEISYAAEGNISHPNPKDHKDLKFSQIRVTLGMTAELEKGDDPEAVFEKLRADVDDLNKKAIQEKYLAAKGA